MHSRSKLNFQPKPIQLCFVSSMNALVYKAIQKPEPMTRNHWSNTRICGQHRKNSFVVDRFYHLDNS